MSVELKTSLIKATSSSCLRNEATSTRSMSPMESQLWSRLKTSESELLANPVDTHINQYLDTVRDLLNQALGHHQAEAATYWSPKGRFRQMVRIVQVNRALDELLNDIRSNHPATIIAGHLDAIRGLLVDLMV